MQKCRRKHLAFNCGPFRGNFAGFQQISWFYGHHLSMHVRGLDKVAHVSLVPGRLRRRGGASVRGWHWTASPRHWTVTADFPRSRLLLVSRSAPSGSESAGDGGGRRRFCSMASASIAVFAFRVWLWVLWDSCPGTSRLSF